ncbi:Rieske [2Fe-2S] domain-containing protein [Filimonas lacunae]|uniref:Rieske [2Fe-2S] domain-containing protein n=1 Tax=Filimonas lacunae TaxID=477680 RepID=A0A173MD66_9BACT|nr:Rieske 2Fe-2S domain-containing protein [Filimonas lacunae]BAV05505.1 hypothetical protein FLA_1512 [Filimonas lacunae]SIT20679.1 Rieske [2Fe-2S] domain-containing protein [Filimonas lacunae]
MQRRDFLKSSCRVCLLGAAGYLTHTLAGCSPATYQVTKTPVVNNTVSLPVALFAQSSLQIVRPAGTYFDIAVRKKEDGTYSALLLQCTHQENGLQVTGNGYVCSEHGSTFTKEGKVTKGPAEEALTQYPTSVNQDAIIIYLKK